jgi:hypothetical protein
MFKRRYVERVVVNEENVEDEIDAENTKQRKPLNFSNISFNDDLPSRFRNNSLNEPIIKRRKIPSSSKIYDLSKHLSIMMDPVVEVKEDDKDKNEVLKALLNSPRVKFMTDSFEDNTFNSPMVNASSFHLPREYILSVEKDEAIAEDNNEYVVDLTDNIRRANSHHKNMIENIIDKEENLNLVELNVNQEASFEPIKEENIEEDDKEVMTHKKSASSKKILKVVLPFADELENDKICTSNAFRYNAFDDDDPIKEIDEEKNIE